MTRAVSEKISLRTLDRQKSQAQGLYANRDTTRLLKHCKLPQTLDQQRRRSDIPRPVNTMALLVDKHRPRSLDQLSYHPDLSERLRSLVSIFLVGAQPQGLIFC
jgi:hypothetical protein